MQNFSSLKLNFFNFKTLRLCEPISFSRNKLEAKVKSVFKCSWTKFFKTKDYFCHCLPKIWVINQWKRWKSWKMMIFWDTPCSVYPHIHTDTKYDQKNSENKFRFSNTQILGNRLDFVEQLLKRALQILTFQLFLTKFAKFLHTKN